MFYKSKSDIITRNMLETIKMHKTFIIRVILAIIVIGSLGYTILSSKINSSKAIEKINTLNSRVQVLEDEFTVLRDENLNLSDALQRAQETASAVESRLKRVNSTVGDLTKLAQTDPELLQKYSKVFFLNEHYAPPSLSEIDTKYTINGKSLKIHSKMAKHLKNLLAAADKDKLSLRVASAYRSFDEQQNLKTTYSVTYGAGTANSFSADQGYSEHQLGTTVDFSTPTIVGTDLAFEQTPEFKWLQENAAQYGFTLSYPKGNAYYVYEPWHWRFVSRKLAEDLVDDKKFFYDLDQRAIDKYLTDFFD